MVSNRSQLSTMDWKISEEYSREGGGKADTRPVEWNSGTVREIEEEQSGFAWVVSRSIDTQSSSSSSGNSIYVSRALSNFWKWGNSGIETARKTAEKRAEERERERKEVPLLGRCVYRFSLSFSLLRVDGINNRLGPWCAYQHSNTSIAHVISINGCPTPEPQR